MRFTSESSSDARKWGGSDAVTDNAACATDAGNTADVGLASAPVPAPDPGAAPALPTLAPLDGSAADDALAALPSSSAEHADPTLSTDNTDDDMRRRAAGGGAVVALRAAARS